MALNLLSEVPIGARLCDKHHKALDANGRGELLK